MAKKLTKEEVIAKIAALNTGVKLVRTYRNMREPAHFKCENGHDWWTPTRTIMAGHGCPHCAQCKKLTRTDINRRLRPRGIFMIEKTGNTTRPASFRCVKGHEWETTLSHVLAGTGCPVCKGCAAITFARLSKTIKPYGIKPLQEPAGHDKKIQFQCDKGHQFKGTPKHVIRKTRCPVCGLLSRFTRNPPQEPVILKGRKVISAPEPVFATIYARTPSMKTFNWAKSVGRG